MAIDVYHELCRCIAEAKEALTFDDLDDAERLMILESCLTDMIRLLDTCAPGLQGLSSSHTNRPSPPFHA